MEFLIVFFVIYFSIAFHELGHLFALRLTKVRALKYTVGIGTRILQLHQKGIVYTFNLFPLGGVVIPVEDDYYKVSVTKRIVIALAGVCVNLTLILVGLLIYVKGDLTLVSHIVKDIVLLLRKDFSYEQIHDPINRFGIVFFQEVDSVNLNFIQYLIIINVVLFVINLLPIPPLDGSKIIIEPAREFFTLLGAKDKTINEILTIITIFGLITLFVPAILDMFLKKIREINIVELLCFIVIVISSALIVLEYKIMYLSKHIGK
ncbi:hypothetical protein CPJCM30710_00890 [Clostridium polyendosporum]|uniref:Peptidase M50 domain-containing protein n=1 Tax=Clostridium polyendosporum TaxID=69208 RepID=A0A919VK99_9CLOT|nr:M50 family metallopeptidase [Clostridium polyendosporum]GIM27423.1 hypothetical protein CPJCM30710_00890 [Clostridium polyendosporum]